MIDNLFVFDFDDTLAETTALIGIARENNGKNHETTSNRKKMG